MGIDYENANFHGCETDFLRRRKIVHWEKKLEVQKKKPGSTDFSSALNTRETLEVRSHMTIACFSRLIVNTATAVTLAGRH